MKYMGQTERSSNTCFQEHFRDFKYRNTKSTFAQHLLENGHTIGPMEEIMETIHFTNKGKLMNTLEKFYIFHQTRLNNQIHDKSTVKPDIIFGTIVKLDPHRGYIMPSTRSKQIPPQLGSSVTKIQT
jgi:hypothetical protein